MYVVDPAHIKTIPHMTLYQNFTYDNVSRDDALAALDALNLNIRPNMDACKTLQMFLTQGRYGKPCHTNARAPRRHARMRTGARLKRVAPNVPPPSTLSEKMRKRNQARQARIDSLFQQPPTPQSRMQAFGQRVRTGAENVAGGLYERGKRVLQNVAKGFQQYKQDPQIIIAPRQQRDYLYRKLQEQYEKT